jgi:hypothetical protein
MNVQQLNIFVLLGQTDFGVIALGRVSTEYPFADPEIITAIKNSGSTGFLGFVQLPKF